MISISGILQSLMSTSSSLIHGLTTWLYSLTRVTMRGVQTHSLEISFQKVKQSLVLCLKVECESIYFYSSSTIFEYIASDNLP